MLEQYKGRLTRDLTIGIIASIITGSTVVASKTHQGPCVDKAIWEGHKREVISCHNQEGHILLQGINTEVRELPEWVALTWVDDVKDVFMYYEHGSILKTARIDLATGNISRVNERYMNG